MSSVVGDRIAALKERIEHGRSYRESMSAQRKAAYGRVFGQTRSEPQVVRMAKALAAFLGEKDLLLFEQDVFAGYQQFYDFSFPLDLECFRDYPHATAEYVDSAPFALAVPAEHQDADVMAAFHAAGQIGLFGACMGGHAIAGYDRVLAGGFGALADAARARLKQADGAGRDFAQASAIVCEAASNYADRYAARADEMSASAAAEADRRRLERMAEACRWIARRPPRTFFEAVQLVWLTHEIITCEQASGSMSLGRLDHYLFPYYQRDREAGRLSRDEAAEIIEALWIKFGALRGGYQNVTLGGCDADGRSVVNDLSHFCLQASGKLKMDQPLISFRWHPSMPDDFWQEIIDLVGTGLGFPAIFNDRIAIEAKCRRGIRREDAADYGIVGCVELNAPGKEFSHTEGVRVSWAKVLELMLNGGCCTLTGTEMKLKENRRLDSLKTFEDFFGWYKQELGHAVELATRAMNIRDRGFAVVQPYPFLSSTMAGCLEAGRDATAGGTTYNLSTINGCGMADTVDSLMAIKRLVYEARSLTLTELADAVRRDFDGAAPLQAELARTVPRFGNDLDEPDALMADLADFFCRRVESFSNPRGGRFQTGLYTVGWHAYGGEMTGALPSGRRRGVSLANGLSPCQGADATGPTAVVKSLTKLDHRLLGNGMVLDLKFHPSFFHEVGRQGAFRDLVETYFELGGLEVQFNVISRETLLAAQANPDEYRDLIVRVSGFSAYFADLDKTCQDEIIARTEHGRPGPAA